MLLIGNVVWKQRVDSVLETIIEIRVDVSVVGGGDGIPSAGDLADRPTVSCLISPNSDASFPLVVFLSSGTQVTGIKILGSSLMA